MLLFETFEVLDFNEAPSSHSNGSNILGIPIGVRETFCWGG